MNVLQINTVCGFGSTGRTSIELARALMDHGDTCHIAYGQGESDYEKSFKIGTRIENHLHNVGSRMFGKQAYYTTSGTSKLTQYIADIQPDVIHLRNLHGNYLNIEILFGYLASIDTPVVWTLHDCWPYTGKCAHYTAVGCDKWQLQCSHCPQVHQYPPSLFLDRSAQMFVDKKRWFSAVKDMTIVPVSHWLAGEVRKSFLARFPIKPIYNWINQEVFKPTLSDARERYQINKDTFVILGISGGWRKDSSKLRDFIDLSRLLPKTMQIVLVGDTKNSDCIPEHIKHIPYVESTNELAKIYSMADVYVHFSTEDTFGKVIAEALACGTPAVVYDSTACPEVVGDGCGFVVERRNVEGAFQAAAKVSRMGKRFFSSTCIAFATENFNYKTNAGSYISLFGNVTEK